VIEGFKTFAEPTVLELAEGMTAVVGPNGCGKSNLVDAIAWAVGSRSWKSLRGGDMTDVIFHGGEATPSKERALVRLVFENPDRALPLDLEEVEVAREIHRATGTKAFINRIEARVKDLQTLLAGTGLVGGFSLVRQGMVDRIVLSPPEELGRWIEEAADIAGFRAKRKEALERLEKVRQNLIHSEAYTEQVKKELRKVRDRAAKAMEKDDLVRQAALLASQAVYLEHQATQQELAELGVRKKTLSEESLEIDRRREDQVALRIQIEEVLSGKPPPEPRSDQPPLPSPERAREKAGRLETAGGFVADLGRLLAREGPPGWPNATKGIHRAIELLRELGKEDDSPGGEPPPDLAESRALIAHLREIQTEIDSLDEKRSRIARDLALLGQEEARLLERRSHLGTPGAPAAFPPAGATPADLRRDAQRLERELAKIGPVDETAQAQEEELARKLEVTKASLKDLREAQSRLLHFLEELDVLAAQVFRHTLGGVERRFGKHFETLFGGGHVRLRLLTATQEGRGEDALDLGNENHSPPIGITVKLPGKKESPLTLLSGGERSLSGIALILALAAQDSGQEKGGRLLIFDEVDAALDQANAVRFARLVQELSKTHQILCVTHCSPTMREAAMLIGVTTGSVPGTSAVVAVALPTAKADLASRPKSVGELIS
jgi:chromosome segregation ATPase